jgi:hypothetical protein
MDNIDWFIDRDEMLLTNDVEDEIPDLRTKTKEELIDLKMGGTEFLSTNPDMDSLNFFALKAHYDLSDYTIFAEDVLILRIADAAIFPDSGYVRIREGGKMETLHDAEIITDTLSKAHHLARASVEIFSRNYYEGSGNYLYKAPQTPLQQIKFDRILVDSLGITIGYGKVPEDDGFKLNPNFAFTGNVNLRADEIFLDCEGGFRIFHDCYTPERNDWVYFHSMINPEEVRLQLSDPIRTVGGEKLESSLFISAYEEEIYPALFDNRKLANDIIMYKAFGSIDFDTVESRYRIFEGQGSIPGNGERYLYLDKKSCTLETFGQVDLGLDFGYIDILSYGKIDYLMVPDSASFNLTLAFDYFFDESLLNLMADSLIVADLKGIDITGPKYSSALVQMLGKEKASELKEDIAVYGTMRRIPEELIHTFVLTDVNMVWNSTTNSYISSGPIGIMSVGINAVNRYVNGHLELIKRRAMDVMTLYLELSPSQYYFFDYRADIMQSLSSDYNYNERIESIKPEKRTTTSPLAEFPYEYTISTRRKVLEFKRRMGQ